jgi:hypothetical protein
LILSIGLVDKPLTTRRVPGEAGGVGEQRREPLYPAADGDVIDVHSAFGQQCFSVTEGKPESHQRTATAITSAGNRNPANAEDATGPR